MSLEKFEQWVLSQNLKPRRCIAPLDRIASKLGYKGPPLIYHSYFKLASIIALQWMIFYPLLSIIVFGLLLQDLSWLKDEWGDAPVFQLLFGTSIIFGSTMAFFIKRESAKLQLPPWKDFSDEKNTAA